MDIPLTKESVEIAYDEAADVLYISIGSARPAVAVETNNGALMRVDPETDELVGITIPDFKDHLE